jgi:adenylate cyclase
VDFCQIIKIARLHEMHTSDFNDPLAKRAAFNRTAELTPAAIFVPIINDEDLLGIICVRNTSLNAHPFDRRDMQFVIAVSQQAALAMQRLQLMEMARREDQAQRLFLRFVSPNETETILKDYFEDGELPGLKEQKITVLFSNVANSAELAEHLGTEHFTRMLNGFYQVATQIIFKKNGMVKYLGDGILAVFTEQPGDMPAEEKAVLAGREFVNALHHTGSLDAKQRIVIGVAINTGPAMMGYVGAKDRAEFNVIGDIVTEAFRMQEFARPYKIIAGHTTVAAIGDKYQFRRAGSVSLGGREQSIQVFEILP